MEIYMQIKLNIQNNPNKYAKFNSWLDCTCHWELSNISIISNIRFKHFFCPVEIMRKCSRPVPVLPFAAHCICFRSNVSIILQPARVGGLLTHARDMDRPSRCRPEPHLFLSLHADKSVAQPPTPPQHIARTPERLTCTVSFYEWPLKPLCCKLSINNLTACFPVVEEKKSPACVKCRSIDTFIQLKHKHNINSLILSFYMFLMQPLQQV